jgi:hypothetical protein
MKDTSTAIDQLFTNKLLALEPEERLAMACRMYSAAKALVRAGIAKGGDMSAAEMRISVFLRLYGQDFDQAKQAKILSRLEAT